MPRLEVAGLEGRGHVRLRQLLRLVEHVVDHHMAHVVHRALRLAFAAQMLDPAGLGDEEPVRNAVRHQAVDLLRHAHVAAAQAGLHVRHRNVQLLGDDGASQGRIDIAHHQHRIRLLRLAQLLEGQHDLGRLLRVAAAARAHEDIRLRNAQLLEEHLVHLPVVMLAGMDDLEAQAAMRLQGAHDRRDLHEVGPRTGDQIDRFHLKVPLRLARDQRLATGSIAPGILPRGRAAVGGLAAAQRRKASFSKRPKKAMSSTK